MSFHFGVARICARGYFFSTAGSFRHGPARRDYDHIVKDWNICQLCHECFCHLWVYGIQKNGLLAAPNQVSIIASPVWHWD